MKTRNRLFICCSSLILSLAAYGRTESFYMSYGTGTLKFVVYNLLFLIPTFLACFYISGKRRDWIIPYGLFLGFYTLALRYVNSKVAIALPNPFPGFGDKILISVYHILLFGFGFFFLILALAMTTGEGRLWKRILALYGALLVGLVYQDWFWFLTHPKGHLVCGSLYGVYFTWWIKFSSLCIPGMYIVGSLTGLSLILIFGERSREFALSVLGLIAAITLTGLALSFCLP